MSSPRKYLKEFSLLIGLLLLALGVILYLGRNTDSITIIAVDMENSPWKPQPAFIISNSLTYPINWITLEPEFQLESGWTITKPIGADGKRISPGNPEPLPPGGTFYVSGVHPTNVAHRVPVVWEMFWFEAEKRPKWKRVADKIADGLGIRPPFLPYGVARSPVIPATPTANLKPNSTNKSNGEEHPETNPTENLK